MTFSNLVAANFFKKESRSLLAFLPRLILRAGESEFHTPPPFPQKNEAGCGIRTCPRGGGVWGGIRAGFGFLF